MKTYKCVIMFGVFMVDGQQHEAGEIIEVIEPDAFYHFTATKQILPVNDETIRGTFFKGVGSKPDLEQAESPIMKTTDNQKHRGRPKKEE